MTSIDDDRLMYHVEVKFKKTHGTKTMTCWYPLASTTPANKKRPPNPPKVRLRRLNSDGYANLGNELGYLHAYSCSKYAGDESNVDVEEFDSIYSHLCNHPWCFNPNHIVYEPEWLGIVRRSCTLWLGECNKCICSGFKHTLLKKPFTIFKCMAPSKTLINKHYGRGLIHMVSDESDLMADIESRYQWDSKITLEAAVDIIMKV